MSDTLFLTAFRAVVEYFFLFLVVVVVVQVVVRLFFRNLRCSLLLFVALPLSLVSLVSLLLSRHVLVGREVLAQIS